MRSIEVEVSIDIMPICKNNWNTFIEHWTLTVTLKQHNKVKFNVLYTYTFINLYQVGYQIHCSYLTPTFCYM